MIKMFFSSSYSKYFERPIMVADWVTKSPNQILHLFIVLWSANPHISKISYEMRWWVDLLIRINYGDTCKWEEALTAYQTGQINVWNLDLFNGECGVQFNATVDLW